MLLGEFRQRKTIAEGFKDDFGFDLGLNMRRVCFIVTARFVLIQFNQLSYFWGLFHRILNNVI